jgi:hypothetical protein
MVPQILSEPIEVSAENSPRAVNYFVRLFPISAGHGSKVRGVNADVNKSQRIIGEGLYADGAGDLAHRARLPNAGKNGREKMEVGKSVIMTRAVSAISSSEAARLPRRLPAIVGFFSTFWLEITRDAVRPYRPELHYMRGPGPAHHAKHGTQLSQDPSIFSVHQP